MPPLSLPMRACLAMALAWAGGFGLAGSGWFGLVGLVLVLGFVAALWWPGSAAIQPNGADGRTPRIAGRIPGEIPGRIAGVIAMLGLAAVLGLLCRTLGRVVIATPAALWALPVVGVAVALRRRGAGLVVLGPALAGLALLAGLAGARFEAAGPQAYGRVFSSPILGVHPRQATAITIDGFGPHDLVVDDYVDPPGGQGYAPEQFAAWLEAELHAIAERHYPAGPARARAAFAGATVEVHEALIPPADAGSYASRLGVEIRSGTAGEGSRVEFGCPGQARDPRGLPLRPAGTRGCPRKYLVDGSTGLGLAPRFPGYTEVRGRDRARLARALGWPSGDPRTDRQPLALESGLWALVLVLGAGLLGMARSGVIPEGAIGFGGRARTALALALALVAGAAALAIALLAPEIAPEQAVGPAEPGSAAIGPTLLALALVLGPGIPAPAEARARAESGAGAAALTVPIALLIALLACSPLAGHGDALTMVAAIREALAGLGLAWTSAGALAGSLAALALAAGAVVAATALVDRARIVVAPPLAPRPADAPPDRDRGEPGHRRADLAALGLALLVAVALAVRKPSDDLALLGGAAALVLLTSVKPRSRAGRRALPLVCALAAAAPIAFADPTWISISALAAAALLALAQALVEFRAAPPADPSLPG